MQDEVPPLDDDRSLAQDSQASATDATEESANPFLAHFWCVLMRVEISEEQAIKMVSGVTPDAVFWNLENLKVVGPGCKICGQGMGESEFCPGNTELTSILQLFDNEVS